MLSTNYTYYDIDTEKFFVEEAFYESTSTAMKESEAHNRPMGKPTSYKWGSRGFPLKVSKLFWPLRD